MIYVFMLPCAQKEDDIIKFLYYGSNINFPSLHNIVYQVVGYINDFVLANIQYIYFLINYLYHVKSSAGLGCDTTLYIKANQL